MGALDRCFWWSWYWMFSR